MDWFLHFISRVWRFQFPVRPMSFVLPLLFLGALLVIGGGGYLSTRAPKDFPKNTPIMIESGLTASEIADHLAAEQVVRFSDLLYIAIVLFHDPEEVKAGAYVFHKPQSVFEVARQITDDNPPLQHVSLTFFEGTTVEQYARTAGEYLNDFDSELFVQHARSYEGFLFPDTYYVPYTYTANDLITLLFETYHNEVTSIMELNATDLSEYEIITLASLIEREGNSEESMRMIAGILSNRLALGMPLQLDASMEYVIDKPLNELTPEDLTVDSPYNTYLNRGLPPTPIGNPGMQSIKAVLDPIPSDFLYYITGNDGNFYYAKTYEEHVANIETYLN